MALVLETFCHKMAEKMVKKNLSERLSKLNPRTLKSKHPDKM
jgi:hypothetical protein